VAAGDSDKNDKDLTFKATGGDTGTNSEGKYDYGSGNNKPSISVFKGTEDMDIDNSDTNTIAKMPCTTSGITQVDKGKTGQALAMFAHEEYDTDQHEMNKQSVFKSVEGTKTCTAVASYVQTGEKALGVPGAEWSDKLWVRKVALTICVSDTSADTFGEAGAKCAEKKVVTQCLIGTDKNNAVNCDSGSSGISGAQAASIAAML